MVSQTSNRFEICLDPNEQNGCHFTDDIFKCIFMNEIFLFIHIYMYIFIALKFVPKGPIDNKSSLVQVMAWRRTGDEPLPEPMLPSSLTHICGTRGRCGKH